MMERFETLLTTGEVAIVFRVDPRTVRRWADEGRLTVRYTVGGQRRYVAPEVHALLRRKKPKPTPP